MTQKIGKEIFIKYKEYSLSFRFSCRVFVIISFVEIGESVKKKKLKVIISGEEQMKFFQDM